MDFIKNSIIHEQSANTFQTMMIVSWLRVF